MYSYRTCVIAVIQSAQYRSSICILNVYIVHTWFGFDYRGAQIHSTNGDSPGAEQKSRLSSVPNTIIEWYASRSTPSSLWLRVACGVGPNNVFDTRHTAPTSVSNYRLRTCNVLCWHAEDYGTWMDGDGGMGMVSECSCLWKTFRATAMLSDCSI